MPINSPKVLISYSHDSPEHRDRVLVLSKRLREEGVDCTIDQYLLVPPEGWPRWMEKQIRESDFVLMVCTETYYRRVLGEEDPGRGRGVRWEGHLVYEAIYQADTRNTKFIPILFNGSGLQWIPPVLQSTSYYDLSSEDGYEDLYRRLTNQTRADKPELGKLRSLPPAEHKSEGALGRLVNVPGLPPHFLPRPGDFQALKDAVLTGLSNPVALTGAGKIGVQGMGGIGKSVLAAALAHDDEVRHAFPDGVIWITLGQTPNLTARQAQVVEALGEVAPTFEDVQRGKSRLSVLLGTRACLLILDDVWQLDHATAFDALGEGGCLMLTTRNVGIVAGLGAIEQRVNLLRTEQALELLARWSGCGRLEELPELAKEVAKECGRLPLALAMAGARVQGDPQGWANVLHRLRHADMARLRGQFPDYPYEDLLKAIDASVEALALEGLRDRYLDFAVFPEDVPIPEATVCAFWRPVGMDEYDVQDALRRMVNLSLLRRDDQNGVSLHDLQHDYVRNQAVREHAGVEDLVTLQRRFLNAYAMRCTKGWPSGPTDGYYFERLPWHLKEAGQIEELKQLLYNFEWLQKKAEATNPNDLIADYNYVADDKDLGVIQSAIRLSAHVLACDVRQLPGQLAGRLLENPASNVQSLLNQVIQWRAWPWLRPFAISFTSPGGPLIRILTGHLDSIRAVAITTDGHRAVSGSWDRTIWLWNPESGKAMQTFNGHLDSVRGVAITADGRRIVSASGDYTLRVWDLESGQTLRTLEGHTHWVTAVAVTADGHRIVSASGDYTLRVWDLESGQTIRTLEGHTHAVRAVAVTPDGRWAVSGSEDRTLRIWDLGTGQTLRTLEGHTHWVTAVAVTADGHRAVSGSWDRALRVWDLESGRTLRILEGHEHRVTAVAVMADVDQAISASWDHTLRVWDLESGKTLRTLEGHGAQVTAVAVTTDGCLAISSSEDRTLRIWNLKSRQPPRTSEGHKDWVTAVAVTADGHRVVSASWDHTLRVWDLGSGRTLHTLEGHGGQVTAVALTANGRLAVSTSRNALRVWNLESAQSLRIIESDAGSIRAVALTADGRRAISGSEDHAVRVWDLEKGQTIRTLERHRSQVTAVAVTADGRRAISASWDRTLLIWDLESGQVLRTLEGHTHWVTAVAMTADGRRAVSGSEDRTLRIWDLESGQTLRILEGHGAPVTGVAVTVDGGRAVSASRDRTVRVWDLEIGQEICAFSGEGRIFSCAIAPGGRKIVAGEESGRVHFLTLVEALDVEVRGAVSKQNNS